MSNSTPPRRNSITEEDFHTLLANRDKGMGGHVRSDTKAVRQLDPRKQHLTSSPVSSEKQGLRERAGSNPAPSPKREYDSKWEETYAAELVMRKHAGLIKNSWYHPFSLWLPGKVRYSPDFLIEYPTGMERKLEVVEVKGWSKNLRDGMTRLKIAAAIFPCFTWKLVKKRPGGGWNETRVG